MNEGAAKPSILAMIDELLTDAGTEERTHTDSLPPASQCPERTPPPVRKITPREFERTVYARMQQLQRKQHEHLKASQQRVEEQLQRDVPAHPVISSCARELRRTPLYLRSIELDKELRAQRDRLHQAKVQQQLAEEAKLLQEQKAAEKRIKAKCSRGPKEFFQFNQRKVQEREAELEERRLQQAAMEVEGLDFKPQISQKSRLMTKKRGSFLARVHEEAKQRAQKLESLRAKYTPSFRPQLEQSRQSSVTEEEVFHRLYDQKRRSSESPKRTRTSEDCASPPRSRMLTLSFADPILEET